MNKFQEMKERADILQDLVNAMSWTKEYAESSVKEWEDKIANAEDDENLEWERGNLERYEYRLSVIREVEKMLEKML